MLFPCYFRKLYIQSSGYNIEAGLDFEVLWYSVICFAILPYLPTFLFFFCRIEVFITPPSLEVNMHCISADSTCVGDNLVFLFLCL